MNHPFTVQFQANTPKDLKEKILAFISEFNTSESVDPNQTSFPSEQLGTSTPPKAAKAKKTAKDEAPIAQAQATTAALATTAPAKDEVLVYLTRVTELGEGVDKARNLLQGFGVKKLSELSQDKYSEFIEACKKVIG